jgi:hypothetical protein
MRRERSYAGEREPFDAALSAVHEFWLELDFGCGRVVYVPVRRLLRRYKRSIRVRDVVRRARCAHCGIWPISAAIVETPDGQAEGRTNALAGWRIELVIDDGEGR